MINQRTVLRWVLVLCAIGQIAPSLSAQPATQLPDGTQFQFWEKPFTPTRTYYVNGTTGNDQNRNNGTTVQDHQPEPGNLRFAAKHRLQ